MTGTPNLGMTLPTVGASSDSWGDLLNENQTLIDAFAGKLMGAAEVTVASAATCNIGAAASTAVLISGTTTITSFGSSTNTIRFVRFGGALILTHNVTSLALLGAANRTVASGDKGIYISDSSGNWREIHFASVAYDPGSHTGSGAFAHTNNPTFTGTLTAPALTASGALTYGGVTLSNAVTGTGNMVLSASPTFTGTAAFATLTASGNATITGTAAVHTTIGGWAGNAIFEVLSGNAIAVSAYDNGTGDALRSRLDNTGGKLASFYFSTGIVGSITTNGSATAYNTSSDARLKDNIVDAPDAGTIIDALRVRSWTWKANGQTEAFGFVAQEEVIPAPFAVRVGDDDPETITEQWGRDDSKLVPLLVKEIQSLRARVAAGGL